MDAPGQSASASARRIGLRRRGGAPAAGQRGSMSIAMILMLIGLVGMLGLVEVGYLYWAKRDTQKVADLAALAGAQRLQDCAADNAGNSAAYGNATTDNGFRGTLTITCGHWDPSISGDQHFVTASETMPRNAVRVVATRPLVPFLGFASFSGIGATAIAAHRGDPIAAFSVGSRLLGLSPTGPLNQLLESTLGTSLGLKLLSYEGVANSNISLLGLKDLLHLDAGTVDEVLNTQVGIGDLLDATVQLLGQGEDSANIDLNLVQQQVAAIKAQLGNIPISLGDILNVNVDSTDPNTALNVDVNAGDLLNAALQAANGKNAVALQALNLNLLGLAAANLSLTIVEPPKIGIGRAGYNSDGTPMTVAHTAQVRLKLDISLLQSVKGNGTLLNLGLASVSLPSQALSNIPLNLELVPAEAWLDSLKCHIPNASGVSENIATIDAQPGAVNAFLGRLPDTTSGNTHQRWQDIVNQAIANGSAYAHLLDIQVDLLGSILTPPVRIKLDAYASAPVERSQAVSHDFHTKADVPMSQQPSQPWSVDTGQDLLASAFTAVLSPNLLHAKLELDGLGLLGNVVAALVNSLAPIVTAVFGVISPVLMPVFETLDEALVGPLLRILGIDIGAADVNLLSVNCDTGVELVY